MITILLADDDRDYVEITSVRLQANGFGVLKAYEGVQVIEVAQHSHPDLILLDWNMPFGKGSAVLEMLAEREDTKSIPVIVVTGFDEPGMKRRAEAMGAKFLLKKPYDPQELLDAIRRVCPQ